MPIQLNKLKESDKGREIVYTDFFSKKSEIGILSSWNDSGIFARFTTGDTANLCSANNCDFLTPEMNTDDSINRLRD